MAGLVSLGRFLHLGVVLKLLTILCLGTQCLGPRAFKDTTWIPAWTAPSVLYNSELLAAPPNSHPSPITHKACLQRKVAIRLFCLGRGLQYPTACSNVLGLQGRRSSTRCPPTWIRSMTEEDSQVSRPAGRSGGSHQARVCT